MKKILSLCVLIGLLSIAVFADVRVDTPTPTQKPKAGKSITTHFDVSFDRNAKEARLLIPKDQLKQLRAELEQLDDSDNLASNGFTKTQTVVSGMFLSLAFVFGGVWFARSRKIDTKTGKVLVIGSVLFLSSAVATIVYANAGPPPEARSLTNRFFSKEVNLYKWGSGKVKMEVSTEVKSPTLIVPDLPDDKKTINEE